MKKFGGSAEERSRIYHPCMGLCTVQHTFPVALSVKVSTISFSVRDLSCAKMVAASKSLQSQCKMEFGFPRSPVSIQSSPTSHPPH